jgi:Flp pilus assembly protein TadD
MARRCRGAGLPALLAALLLVAPGCAMTDFFSRGPSAAEDSARARAAAKPAPRSEASWEELMARADRDRLAGDVDQATVGYLRALQEDPDRSLSRIRIAQIQLTSQPAQAAATFRRVLEMEPDSVRAQAGLGLAALAIGEIGEARQAFEATVASAPESAVARAGLAVSLDLLGESAAAADQLARAQTLRPEDAWLLNNLGVSRLLAGDWPGAEAALRAAASLDPGDSAVGNNLGLALGRMERYEEALAAFRSAGDERAAQNNLGYVYFLNGMYAAAIAQYESALAVPGADAEIVLDNLNAALDALDHPPALADAH